MNEDIFENSYPKINKSKTKTWVYPHGDELKVRLYQKTISREALFKNTLVCLPTGLGKTLIAAVVMYNFHRWYPDGQIIFMAHTKPLVHQQIRACFEVMNVDQSITCEINGTIKIDVRKRFWRQKKFFFCTPQTVKNDMIKNKFVNFKKIVLVIFDEAHKARGNFAYCQVRKALENKEARYRILALSATPGRDVWSIQEVVNNMLIENICVRSEDDADVKSYTHTKDIEVKQVPISGEIASLRDLFSLHFLQKHLDNLVVLRTIKSSIALQHTAGKFQHIISLDSTKGRAKMHVLKMISLYSPFDKLLYHGIVPFVNGLKNIQTGDKRYLADVRRNKHFNTVLNRANNMIKRGVVHPKILMLERIVKDHFSFHRKVRRLSRGTKNPDHNTSVIVFAQYRDSVVQIVQRLSKIEGVKPIRFVGQASTGTSLRSRGLKQHEQQEIIEKFKSNDYNVLVSTSVGEEGLDIGNVDLIICFDGVSSPVRMIQRMGRTGRKRRGRCVMILTEGMEVKKYENSVNKRKKVLLILKNSKHKIKMNRNASKLRLKFLPMEKLKKIKRRKFTSPVVKKKKSKRMQGISNYERSYLQNKFGEIKLQKDPKFFKKRFKKLCKKDYWLTSQEMGSFIGKVPHNNTSKWFVQSMNALCSEFEDDDDDDDNGMIDFNNGEFTFEREEKESGSDDVIISMESSPSHFSFEKKKYRKKKKRRKKKEREWYESDDDVIMLEDGGAMIDINELTPRKDTDFDMSKNSFRNSMKFKENKPFISFVHNLPKNYVPFTRDILKGVRINQMTLNSLVTLSLFGTSEMDENDLLKFDVIKETFEKTPKSKIIQRKELDVEDEDENIKKIGLEREISFEDYKMMDVEKEKIGKKNDKEEGIFNIYDLMESENDDSNEGIFNCDMKKRSPVVEKKIPPLKKGPLTELITISSNEDNGHEVEKKVEKIVAPKEVSTNFVNRYNNGDEEENLIKEHINLFKYDPIPDDEQTKVRGFKRKRAERRRSSFGEKGFKSLFGKGGRKVTSTEGIGGLDKMNEFGGSFLRMARSGNFGIRDRSVKDVKSDSSESDDDIDNKKQEIYYSSFKLDDEPKMKKRKKK